jgi:K+-transporting ATPase ATPase C chain
MRNVVVAIKAFLVFAILLGILYPLAITLIGKSFMPYPANGSLIINHGKIIGSKLIAQEFTDAKYFHSRFSAVNYDAENSGASNFAPTNKNFLVQTKARIAAIRREDYIKPGLDLPADMVTASGSGLDPHISLENALLQLPRVAAARNLQESVIKSLILQHTNHDFIGLWGKAGINVLELNLALDKLTLKEQNERKQPTSGRYK